MNTVSKLSALFLLFAFSGGAHSASDGNGRYQVFHFEALNAKVVQYGNTKQKMSFQALGRDFEIRLRDNRRLIDRLSDELREKILSQMEILSGELEGVPGSWVRLTRQGQQWRGLIWDGYEMFIVESGEMVAKASETPLQTTGGTVIYRLADTSAEFSDFAIEIPGNVSLQERASQASASSSTEAFGVAMQATKSLDIAAIGDFEFTNAVNGDGTLDITNFINGVDGIFYSDLEMLVNLVELRTFPQNNDPFSGTSDARARIDELTAYKLSDPVLRNLGLIHLFTGVDLDGTTIGIAFLDAVCDQEFGAGITQAINAPTPTHLITAHEMGHNFGAPHDGDPAEACASVVGNFLMDSNFNGSDRFSACSIAQMQPVIAAASCLNDLTIGADLSMTLTVTDSIIANGGSTTVRMTVDNSGPETADNVTATLDLGSLLTIAPGQTFTGCTAPTSSTLDCNFGSMIPRARQLFDIAVDASTGGAGAAAIQAQAASSTVDSNTANNSESTIVSVANRIVDVFVSAGGAPPVLQMGSTASTLVTVDNAGPDAAEQVSVSITVGAGLGAMTVTGSGGVCSATPTTVNCSYSELAGQQSFTINFAATAVGNQNIQIATTLGGNNNVDTNNANNNVSFNVTVTNPPPPPPAPSSSGGGAAGLLLPFLMLMLLRRRRMGARQA